MSGWKSAASAPVEELYELCVKHGFIDARPVVARGLARSRSAPGLLVRPREVTWMLRNVPCCVGEERMESVLSQHGFAGSYDYLYMPLRKGGSNLGYGFVNFTSEEDALRFKAFFVGYKFSGINSAKECYVTLADIQGREANIQANARYRKTDVA